MSNRLADPKSVPEEIKPKRDKDYVKIGLQMLPDLHEKISFIATKKKCEKREILNDAVKFYLEANYPDIGEEMRKFYE